MPGTLGESALPAAEMRAAGGIEGARAEFSGVRPGTPAFGLKCIV
jgi:hypothetical protein